MRGRKKPKATDQSLLTHRKETPNIIQVFPISMPSVKMILAPGDAALSVLRESENDCRKKFFKRVLSAVLCCISGWIELV